MNRKRGRYIGTQVTPASGGFRAGWYKPDAPGRPLPEPGGETPPPPPINNSTGGRETSLKPGPTRLREATARNIARHEAALSRRKFSWEEDV